MKKRTNLGRAAALCALVMVFTARVSLAQESTPPPEAEPMVLTVWLPESLAGIGSEAAQAQLAAQITAFETAHPDLQVEIRIKREGSGAGTILSTLSSASLAAPGALPQVALVRRADLLTAVQNGLIYPLPTAVDTLTSDLLPAVEALGQVNGNTYGLPFALETIHLAYQDSLEAPETWGFEDVLNAEFNYALPAGMTTQVNTALFAQYVALDDDLLASDALVEDRDALERLYRFYEAGAESGMFGQELLTLETFDEYLPELAAGDLPAGVVTSTAYLRINGGDSGLLYGAIPTESGEMVTSIDGWLWVMPTPLANEQAAAMEWIAFFADPSRQQAYTEQIGILPASRTALNGWGDDSGYAAFTDGLLRRALIPPTDTSENAGFTRALQNGLAMVLSGEMTAAEAAAAVTRDGTD